MEQAAKFASISIVEKRQIIEEEEEEEPQPQTNKRLLFTWIIGNFSSLNTKEEKQHYSDVFTADGYKWRVVLRNSVDHHLSMYLDAADSSTLRNGWIRCTEFSLAVVNQLHNNNNNKKNKKVRRQDTHQFTAQESIRGFTHFMPLSELYDPHRGFFMNDTLLVEAYVAVRRVVDYWTYDSKKETGYVGLKNQKHTWRMNSVLQILYHIPYLRKALHDMPTTENDIPSISVPLALRNLFYELQYSNNSVATKELTEVLYSDNYNPFICRDVPKFSWFLREMLEAKMKETIQWLFKGHYEKHLEFDNVADELNKKVSFYDIELDVQGCRDVYASFDKYVKAKRYEGRFQHYSDQHGWQDAKEGVRFIDFPPVLRLQLNRFIRRGSMVKINDRYEFPLELDLDRENKKYLSPGAKSVRNLYTLHSLLVHSDRTASPRFYALIRPTLADQWYKFVDKWVSKVDMKGALEEQYGGEEKTENAYQLVYIRESDKKKILCNTDEKDIAEHLRKEQEEKEHKKKEKPETRLCTIKVARNEDLLDQIGKEINFDLVDHDKVSSLRVEKQMPFHIFKKGVAKKFGVPVEFQRFWLWAKRPNNTYRPHRPLTDQEETETVEQRIKMSDEAHSGELKLFLEVEFGLDSRPIATPRTKEDILLFFKFCDPVKLVKRELRYVGWLLVKGNGEPAEILSRINKLAGFSPDEEIELYEEINFEPSVQCRHIDKKQTFQASKLQDGDIICFQKSQHDCCYDVPSFLESIHGFKPLTNARRKRRQPKKSGGRR